VTVLFAHTRVSLTRLRVFTAQPTHWFRPTVGSVEFRRIESRCWKACPARSRYRLESAGAPLSGNARRPRPGNCERARGGHGDRHNAAKCSACCRACPPEACTRRTSSRFVPFKISVTGETCCRGRSQKSSVPASTTAMVRVLLKEMRFSAGRLLATVPLDAPEFARCSRKHKGGRSPRWKSKRYRKRPCRLRFSHSHIESCNTCGAQSRVACTTFAPPIWRWYGCG